MKNYIIRVYVMNLLDTTNSEILFLKIAMYIVMVQ